MDPAWPLVIAWIMSRASPPRHSPTITRSGRIRRLFLKRSRIVTSPRPYRSAARDSRPRTCGCFNWSSLDSSMTTMRRSAGMNSDITFRRLVLPLDVPPLIRRFFSVTMHSIRKSRASSLSVPLETRNPMSSACRANLRIVTTTPRLEHGGMATWTRDPSGNRASIIGCSGEMRLPTYWRMFREAASRADSFGNFASVRSRRPRRSM